MMTIILFLAGLAIGSFLNVLSLRYRPDGRLISRDIIFGRSHCPYCRATLRWYELIPLLSFIFQLGRCLRCRQKISWQYPVVELLSGFALAAWPLYPYPAPIWILVVLVSFFIAAIDLRLSVIPDQLNLLLGVLAFVAILKTNSLNLITDNLLGLATGGGFIGLIVFLSRGRGMGLGDLKMSAALGFLFGWPKIVALLGVAFVIGGIFSAILLIAGRKTLKDAVPFGPFLSTAAILVIFFGDGIIK